MIQRKLGEHGGRIFEAKKDSSGRKTFPVVIIAQGLGNLVDKNYYTEEAIKSGVTVYNGKKAYYDHPTATQEEEQPGRSVKEICGHYEDCQAVKNKEGLWELRATFVPMKSKVDVTDLIEHSIEYKKKFPNDEFVGVSICGDGAGQNMEYDEFIKTVKPQPVEMDKIKQIEGQSINVITQFTNAQSADIVTEAGAKGRYLQESKTKRRRTMFEAMKKFIFGAEKNDKNLMESAAKELEEAAKKEDEDEKKKEKKAKKEDEDEKKESKKKEDEDEKKESKKKEDEDESEDEKKESKKKKEDEDSEDEKKESKKEDDDGDADDKKKKESKSKKEDEDDDHKDADQDKKLIKKMMKQMDEMKKEIESLKSKKEDAEKEAKKHHEESAQTKVALQAKEKAELIEGVVARSGLPYSVTEGLKSLFVSKSYSKEEMKKIVETAKDTYSKGIEEVLMGGASVGFTEIETTESSKGSNDHLLM